jgi:hypothetical protein
MTKSAMIPVCLSAVLICGCVESSGKDEKEPGNSVLHKTTQDIGKFDPNDKGVVSDQKIRATDPVTAPLSAYGPMVESLAKTQIKSAVETFNAVEGRYPKDHEEFMERIIKENNIKLPVLPYKGRYSYDEVNHELVIKRDPEDAAKQ